MTREDVIALARAGFNREQIVALAGAMQPAAAPAPAPAPAPSPAPAPDPAPAPGYEEILRKLGVLTDTIQGSALLGANQPAPETADDILANIIDPPRPAK